ncbi:hypothetical protein OAK75_00745 [Bacteriovoracales bacterium]|nr:hypothetical protein [Bacteriovoracales bacterium]
MGNIKNYSRALIDLVLGFFYLLWVVYYCYFHDFEFFKKGESLLTKAEILEIESGNLLLTKKTSIEHKENNSKNMLLH